MPKTFTCIGKLFGAKRTYGFFGRFPDWDSAEQKCSGYDAESVFDAVRKGSLKVRDGYEGYERDSVLFDKISYSWPVLSALMWVAARNDGHLRVADFGGALGSSYRQMRRFLSGLKDVCWGIVEQSRFVKIGCDEFASEELKFFINLKKCREWTNYNVVLASGVLQYLRDPQLCIEEMCSSGTDVIVIDRIGFLFNENVKRITIQKVPPSIYNASYPCWFFNRDEFIGWFERNGFKLYEEFKSALVDISLIDGCPSADEWGLIFVRQS